MDSNNMNGNNVNGQPQNSQGAYQQVTYQQAPQTAYQQAPQTAYQQTPQTVYQQPQYQQAPAYSQPAVSQVPQIPENYKPISAWGYVGYSLLFSIPLVGLILLIVFSFSDANINRRNFARSFWCALLLGIIITVVAVIIMAALGVSLMAAFS